MVAAIDVQSATLPVTALVESASNNHKTPLQVAEKVSVAECKKRKQKDEKGRDGLRALKADKQTIAGARAIDKARKKRGRGWQAGVRRVGRRKFF